MLRSAEVCSYNWPTRSNNLEKKECAANLIIHCMTRGCSPKLDKGIHRYVLKSWIQTRKSIPMRVSSPSERYKDICTWRRLPECGRREGVGMDEKAAGGQIQN